jgi:hypothetical protein
VSHLVVAVVWQLVGRGRTGWIVGRGRLAKVG